MKGGKGGGARLSDQGFQAGPEEYVLPDARNYLCSSILRRLCCGIQLKKSRDKEKVFEGRVVDLKIRKSTKEKSEIYFTIVNKFLTSCCTFSWHNLSNLS